MSDTQVAKPSKEDCTMPGEFYIDADMVARFPIFNGLVNYNHTVYVNEHIGFLQNFKISEQIMYFLQLDHTGKITITDPQVLADLAVYNEYVLGIKSN
jgi:hypothetical protein